MVIDDFHYIPVDVQLDIVRGLKPLVFDGLRVVIASVPHRAFDAVRVEKEMTGRVEQLPIPMWERSELEAIALRGFEETQRHSGVRRHRAAREGGLSEPTPHAGLLPPVLQGRRRPSL